MTVYSQHGMGVAKVGGRECNRDACAAVMCLIFHKHSQGALLPGRYNNLHQLQAGYLGACSFMGHLTDHANACSCLWPMHKRFHTFRGGNRGEKHGADLASALGDIDAGRKKWLLRRDKALYAQHDEGAEGLRALDAQES